MNRHVIAGGFVPKRQMQGHIVERKGISRYVLDIFERVALDGANPQHRPTAVAWTFVCAAGKFKALLGVGRHDMLDIGQMWRAVLRHGDFLDFRAR